MHQRVEKLSEVVDHDVDTVRELLLKPNLISFRARRMQGAERE
jgi:hypothetical protein